MTTIGVFFGGRSVEHEVSIISAIQAINAFTKFKYELVPVYISKKGTWYTGADLTAVENYKDIPKLLLKCKKVYLSPTYGDYNLYNVKSGIFKSQVVKKLDIAFPILHGSSGEDGSIQGLFELIGIPYVGSDLRSSAIGIDKITTKAVLRENGLPTVEHVWFTDRNWFDNQDTIYKKIQELGFPLIVKPADLGSSIGISKVNSKDELSDAIELAGSFSNKIVVEKIISPLKEINCSVLGDSHKANASVCEEPMRSGDILSYKDKYMSEGKTSKGMSSTQRKIPADLSNDLTKEIQELAVDTFKSLGCSGVARIDFLVNRKTNKVFINEVNTIPGSLSFYLWEATNKKYAELLDDLISIALKRKRENNNLMVSYTENILANATPSLKLSKAN
ncbi:MAG: D-alanine--D-alanine ligase [Bacteroidetes bacterium 4572_117]|nr:MAG: D-alanine--D-alanine ligase [Bacteroidetes bacterium 4572_117]